MAYMRGKNYLWSDGNNLHIWVADGYDNWDESGWHLDDDGKNYPVAQEHQKDGKNVASGVGISQGIMDEYVVMRLSEMIDEGLLEATVDRAVTNWSGTPLQRYAKKIKMALKQVKID